MKPFWIAIGETYLERDKQNLSGKIAGDIQGNRKDQNRQNKYIGGT